MARVIQISLLGLLLLGAPACSGGGVDTRNKDLDRPKSADEKPAAPAKNKAADEKPAAPDKSKSGDDKAAGPAKK